MAVCCASLLDKAVSYKGFDGSCLCLMCFVLFTLSLKTTYIHFGTFHHQSTTFNNNNHNNNSPSSYPQFFNYHY
ncbi:hypothetical protein QVD17_28418 [Tagetes erecta]|uniref:Uncharacterized protein n=1 Tax=Tagetes erecta TaxID=13708 RepID=A0AAD8NS39_TARER|nr:hypothetical protein QVD17_28418 [Tagetes erecta]